MKKALLNMLLTALMMTATAYCSKGITRSGEEVREGICAGGDAIYGQTVHVFKRMPDNSVGEYIGRYECLDTGSTEGIINNNVIDIWKPDLNACQEMADLTYSDGCDGRVWVVTED